jgi:hypothetical protein
MISVTPLAQTRAIAAQRTTILRTTVVTSVAFAAIAFVVSRLANLTGDMLSAFVLVMTALVTMVAIVAPGRPFGSR